MIDRSRLVHEAFEAQALRTPARVAVACGSASMTYRELNQQADRLAGCLTARGAGPEGRVGVLLERSVDWVWAVLGILKCGAAYLPLDASWPKARIEGIARDAKWATMITRRALYEAVRPQVGDCTMLDELGQQADKIQNCNPKAVVGPENVAYVIYTSGSTGSPKGVMVEHRSLSNLVDALHKAVYRDWQRAGLRVGLNGPLCFDTSVKQLVQLCLGHSLYIVPEEARLDASRLAAFANDSAVDVLDCTPTQLSSWLSAGLFAGKGGNPPLVLVGGEAISPRLWSQLLGLTDTAFYNLYGPAECTVDAAVCRIGPPRASPSIGSPIAGIQVHVLDEAFEPLPPGNQGELYLGGVGLARGYLHQPRLTAERFLPNPFAAEGGARLYRSGDLGRELAGGELEFLGRSDHQVKLRGVRIELGEIQAVLGQQPGVRESVVVMREDGGGNRLVAYLVPEYEAPRRDQARPASQLRQQLRALLPEYMIPSALVWMSALPVTPNGKLDRAALPMPEIASTLPFLAPRTPIEEVVAAIWSDVLGRARVGVHDNFFELGGHSLLVGQVAARIRDALQREVPLQALFECDTVAKTSAFITQAEGANSDSKLLPIQPVPRSHHHPVSFAQERICFLQRLAPENVAYLFRTVLRFIGKLDAAALEGALGEIVCRHESFRTTFILVDGRPRQRVHPPWPFKLPVVDLARLGRRAQAPFQQILAQQFRKGFDISALPLVRWALVRLGEHEHALVHAEHHLIHDGWSFNVFLSELRDLYSAFTRGSPSPLPDLPIQLVDFCEWQHEWMKGEEAQQQLDYWKGRLAGAEPVLDLPLDRPRPKKQSFNGAIERIELPPEVADALRQASRRENATLFMTMTASFFALLSRYTGQNDICIGSGIANRRRRETESLIGMIINTIVLRASLDGELDFRALLQQVRSTTLEAYAHQDAPFDAVVEAVQPRRDLSHNPLFQVAFSFHDAPLSDLELSEVKIEVADLLDNGSAKFDMNIVVIPRAEQRARGPRMPDLEGITFIWEYNRDLFEAATIQRMFGHYARILQAMAGSPEARVAGLKLLTKKERRQLDDWTATAAPYPEACVHDLIAEVASRIPEAAALVAGEGTVSYARLNRRSNRLARQLQAQGSGHGAVIGVCLGRSAKLVEGLLAVLKAGAAYLPIEGGHPTSRLQSILRDAGASLLLTDSSTAPQVAACGLPALNLEADGAAVERQDGMPLSGRTRPDELAYIIYTSGSTGVPKGVAVPHRSLTNLLTAMRDTIGIAQRDGMFALTGITFDIAALELFLPLTTGASCWVASDSISGGAGLLKEIEASSARFIQATPSGWRALIEQGWRGDARVIALSGGETLPEPLARSLLGRSGIVWNLYGPTETTIWSTAHQLKAGDPTVPIGRPLANTQTLVLDAWLQHLPIGVVGELAIGGAGLALGYLNRRSETASSFVPNPYSELPGDRMYRTGDLVRHRSDGSLEFLGRSDHQVKVRGFRIELGEIEAALLEQAGVRAAVVAAAEDRPDGRRLVAYVVPEAEVPRQEQRQRTSDLRQRLQEKLPEYMMPSVVVWLAALPLTANGKVDRKALPYPEVQPVETCAPPRTHVEAVVAAIWSEVLGCAQIGIHDDFFMLGGHSFSAMQVASRVWRDLGVDLPVQVIFEQPVLADCAASIESYQPEDSPSGSWAGTGSTAPDPANLPS